MLRYIISVILSSLPILCTAASADTLIMSLDEAIMLARSNSLDASVAVNELRTAYWQWRSFKANRLPELSFSGTIPSYTKNYSCYRLDDGSYTFVRNNYIGLNGKLSVNQIIPFTGGTL